MTPRRSRRTAGLWDMCRSSTRIRAARPKKEQLETKAKRRKAANYTLAEDRRYNERGTVERVNGRIKDEFGARMVRVRGHAKVMTHLMFGIVALTVDQLMKFVE
ncbi:MAG: transposase [Shimia sp.]|nr:transposase [Shimia sp.]